MDSPTTSMILPLPSTWIGSAHTFEFKASETSKVMTIVVPDDYKSGSELKVKIPDEILNKLNDYI